MTIPRADRGAALDAIADALEAEPSRNVLEAITTALPLPQSLELMVAVLKETSAVLGNIPVDSAAGGKAACSALRVRAAILRADTPSTPAARRLVRIPEAAAYSGLTQRLVRELVHRKQIAHHRVGRVVLIDLEDLDRLLDEGRTEAIR